IPTWNTTSCKVKAVSPDKNANCDKAGSLGCHRTLVSPNSPHTTGSTGRRQSISMPFSVTIRERDHQRDRA
ncbi:hypothetical protein N9D23_13215, partial [Rubripirellula sp.]|nr:hypothetical protein [Rubripirellula sp.]